MMCDDQQPTPRSHGNEIHVVGGFASLYRGSWGGEVENMKRTPIMCTLIFKVIKRQTNGALKIFV